MRFSAPSYAAHAFGPGVKEVLYSWIVSGPAGMLLFGILVTKPGRSSNVGASLSVSPISDSSQNYGMCVLLCNY